ncbi:MAG TPA: isocitrate lyase/phosphoenolpyruvate mutase family protein [Terriglobia bacterium]|nr:isocitrate lyase/phosphoenolpyruvate mutase family protein [Terriglobia bacterium]
MNNDTQVTKAKTFRRLHEGPGILILPNAWDAASARIFEMAGFSAIGTTSAGVAYSLGYADGEHVPVDEMIAAIFRIVRSVSLPVTADIEAGYSETTDGVVETVKKVIEAGAVGVNLEDSRGEERTALFSRSAQSEKIRAIRAASEAAGVPLVINARTDVYLAGIGELSTRFQEAVERANAYGEAGADCLFIPGVRHTELISALVRAVHGPINILATQGTPRVQQLEKAGVRRVSVGSGPARAAMTLVRRLAMDLKTTGDYSKFTEATITHSEANELFKK